MPGETVSFVYPGENKTNWFPEGPDIRCFVIFLNFHFNSIKRSQRITGANKTVDSVLIETQIQFTKPLNE